MGICGAYRCARRRSDELIVWSQWTVVEYVVDGDELLVLRNVDVVVYCADIGSRWSTC